MDIKVGDLVTIHKAGETFTGLYVGATTEVTAVNKRAKRITVRSKGAQFEVPCAAVTALEPDPHADSMMQYAEDAKRYAHPWRFWEHQKNDGPWAALSTHPAWTPNTKYRRKKVPPPPAETVAPQNNTLVYIPSLAAESLCFVAAWGSSPDRNRLWLERGLVHLTAEAAIAHAEAILESLKGTK